MKRGICQFTMLPYGLSIMSCSPDFSGRVVTVKVHSLKFGKPLSVQDNSTSQRSCFGMMMLKRRFDMRSGAQFAIQIERVASFVNGPAVIVSFTNKVDLFPKILSVVTNPDVTCFPVDRHAPGVPQSEGPGFRCDPGTCEGIVCRYGVMFARCGMIDINPQHF